jgi:hypothetical protein
VVWLKARPASFKVRDSLEEGIFERYRRELIAVAALVFVLVIVALAVGFAGPQKPKEQSYSFEYGPVAVEKKVSIGEEHKETITVSAPEAADLIVLLIFVPKQLAQSAADIEYFTNGGWQVLKADPWILVRAKDTNTIIVELGKLSLADSCTVNVVMHKELFDYFSKEQLDELYSQIISVPDSEITCAKANEIEKKWSARIFDAVKAASEEASTGETVPSEETAPSE